MGFWIFMLVMALALPVVMIVIGWRFVKRPPKEINNSFGYRSARSMRSQEAWDFANLSIGRLWRAVGWVTLPLSALAMLLVFGKEFDEVDHVCWIACMAQLVLMLASIIPVELALRKNFDGDGNRRRHANGGI